MKKFLATFTLIIALSSCGIKGNLYIPENQLIESS
ncbi:LPS translocon maturation chaperone LptM [Rickettsiales endosymbiont of Stachyamoeba lipophora]